MYNWTNLALETAQLRGAAYADVRVMHLRQRDLTTKNGQVGTLAQSESIGLGIRVLASGGVGICVDGPVDARGRGGVRGAGGGDCEGFGDGEAQRSGDGGRAGLHR